MNVPAFPALWRISLALVRRDRELLLTIGAATLFLPSLLFSWLSTPYAADKGMSLPLFFFAFLNLFVTYLGQATIFRLLLGHEGTVRQLLVTSLPLVIPLVATVFLFSFSVAGGLLCLVAPGIYLAGRLVLAAPLLVDQRCRPLDALRHSWRATQGLGFRYGLMVVGLGIAILGGLLLLAGVGSASFGSTADVGKEVAGSLAQGVANGMWPLGRWVFELLLGIGATIGSIYMNAFYVVLYRHSLPPASSSGPRGAGS